MQRTATNHFIRWTTLALGLGFAWAQSSSAQHFPDDAGLLDLIQTRVEEGRSAGIVVGVLEADGTRRIAAFGDPGPDARPLGPNSVFEIGSITKVFTAIVLADMVAKGDVTLEAPIQAYVHDGVTIPSRSGREITLLDLSTHRSSFPRMPDNIVYDDPLNPFVSYNGEALHEFLNEHELSRDIGSQYEYSNLAVGLLGHLVAARAGTDYETVVRERILAPLGMSMTGITLTPEMEEQLAIGHDASGAPTKNWDFPELAGAGALRSNMHDMLDFIEANIGEPKNDLERAMRASHESRVSGPQGMEVALNWHILPQGDDKIVWHNGGTGGYRTFAGFDPKKGIGAVVLTNSGGEGADDIGVHLLNPDVPLTPAPAPVAERVEVEIDPAILQRYVGEYEIIPEFTITVTVEDDALFVRATDQARFPAFPESETKFFLKVLEAQVSFVIEDGEVTSLILHQGGAEQTGRKIR